MAYPDHSLSWLSRWHESMKFIYTLVVPAVTVLVSIDPFQVPESTFRRFRNLWVQSTARRSESTIRVDNPQSRVSRNISKPALHQKRTPRPLRGSHPDPDRRWTLKRVMSGQEYTKTNITGVKRRRKVRQVSLSRVFCATGGFEGKSVNCAV